MSLKLISLEKHCFFVQSLALCLWAIGLSTSAALVSISSILFLLYSILQSIYNKKFSTCFIDKASRHPISIAIYILLAFCVISSLWSVGDRADQLLGLKKISRLLFFPFILTFFEIYPAAWKKVLLVFLIGVGISMSFGIIYYVQGGSITFFRYGENGLSDSITMSMVVAFSLLFLLNLWNADVYLLNKRIQEIIIVLSFFYLFFVARGRTGQLVFTVLFPFIWLEKIMSKKNLFYLIAILCTMVTIFISISVNSEKIYNILSKDTPKMQILEKSMSSLRYFRQALEEYSEFKNFIRTTDKEKYIDEAQLPKLKTSTGIRAVIYYSAWSLIKDQLFLGYGIGSFKNVYMMQYPSHFGFFSQAIQNPHNQFLLTLTEEGLLGLLGLFYFFMKIFQTAKKLSSISSNVLFAICVSFIVGCCFNSWLTDFKVQHFYLLMIPLFIAGGGGTLGISNRTIFSKKVGYN